MNARFDPISLTRELLALIPQSSFVGCRSGTRRDQDGSDDVTQIIDWTAGHPTPAERGKAQGVLAAHDMGRRRSDQTVRARRIEEIDAKIKLGTDTAAEIRERRRLEIEYRENGGAA